MGNNGVKAMKKLTVMAIAAALSALAGGVGAQGVPQDEVVQRGYGSTIPFTTIDQGVRVIRGRLPEPKSGQVTIAAPPPPRIQPLGDGTFFDNEGNRIVTCFRRRTTQVGRVRFVCLSRNLGS